jgi:hypothetical protein
VTSGNVGEERRQIYAVHFAPVNKTMPRCEILAL